MKLLPHRRRHTLPAETAHLLGVTPADRVIAWSRLVGGGAVAATEEKLHILTPMGKQIARPWTDVDRAVWDAKSGTLALWWVQTRQGVPLEIEDHRRLADTVHACIRASIVMSTQVLVKGGRPVWVAVRRNVDGRAFLQVVPPPGVDLDDPEVAAEVSPVVASVRSQAGLDEVDDASEVLWPR